MLFRRHAPPLEHAELNDCISVGAAGGVEKIGAVQRKETMRPLVGRILKRVHDTRVNDIRKLPLDGVELLSQSKNFDL